MNSVTQYKAPRAAFIDGFGGLTSCTVIEVIEPGEGNQFEKGKIRVRVDETRSGYSKGEVLVLGPRSIVPKDRLRERGYHYRIDTRYAWVQE